MELYILDSLWRRVSVVDKFVSCIWTENFSGKGEFELIVHSTLENRTRFTPGVKLAMNKSKRVMIVETLEDVTDDEGKRAFKVTGPSLESILEHRGSYGSTTGLPKDIVEHWININIVDSSSDPNENIPGIIEANIFPADTIDPPSEEITWELLVGQLHKPIKDLCDMYAMGWRIVRDPDTNLLYVDVYMGRDRTTQQTVDPAVVFSPDMENLRNTRQFSTMETFKNVATVYGSSGAVVVYAPNVPEDVSGFELRMLAVNALDVELEFGAAEPILIQRGKEALAKCRPFQVLDGEVAQNNQYVYGVDYNLGDLVELRDAKGTTSVMQVTQQIFTQDVTGERSYPTLLINLFVYPGSWLDWDFGQEWDELTTEEWSDLP